MTKNCIAFIKENGIYTDLYQIVSKDLVNGDPDEIEMDCFTWAKFYKTYGMDGNYFLDVSMQYNKATRILETHCGKESKSDFEPMIRKKISELEYRERYTVKKSFSYSFLENRSRNKIGKKSNRKCDRGSEIAWRMWNHRTLEEISPTKRNRFYLRLQIKIHKYFNVPDFGT